MSKQEIGSCYLMVAITHKLRKWLTFIFGGGGGGRHTAASDIVYKNQRHSPKLWRVSKVYLLTDDFSMEQKRFLSVR